MTQTVAALCPVCRFAAACRTAPLHVWQLHVVQRGEHDMQLWPAARHPQHAPRPSQRKRHNWWRLSGQGKQLLRSSGQHDGGGLRRKLQRRDADWDVQQLLGSAPAGSRRPGHLQTSASFLSRGVRWSVWRTRLWENRELFLAGLRMHRWYVSKLISTHSHTSQAGLHKTFK